MRTFHVRWPFVAAFALVVFNSSVRSDPAGLETASGLFAAGKFDEAEKACAAVLAAEPKNSPASLLCGRLALLANRLDDAQKYLSKAAELDPQETTAKALLAEAFYRRDEFEKAAPLFRAAGREAMAKKLESFRGLVPYQIEGTAGTTEVKFSQTDPLPALQARVNGSEEVLFILDTGGAELILDPEFAKQAGVKTYGSESGTFGGGKQAGYEHGRADSVTLGGFVLKNVPVHLLDTRKFAAVTGGRRVDGVLGTVLLYHFLPTLDYPGGKLTLRRKNEESRKALVQAAEAEKQSAVPFRMAGDHLILAWGTVNRSKPMLFFVDTGLAGGGFVCPESTLKSAGISVDEGLAAEGVGGGGKVRIIPFVVDELSLGEVKAQKIRGIFGAFPPTLENGQGFSIGGLISHQFFRPYALTLDFSEMKLYLKKP